MIAPLRGPRAMLTGLPLLAGLALAGCASTPAPAPSPDEVATVSAVVTAVNAAATLAIARTRDQATIKDIKAAEAALNAAWAAYQQAVAAHEPVDAAAVDTAVSAALSALTAAQAPAAASGG